MVHCQTDHPLFFESASAEILRYIKTLTFPPKKFYRPFFSVSPLIPDKFAPELPNKIPMPHPSIPIMIMPHADDAVPAGPDPAFVTMASGD
jgi:hypothetical protein